MGGALGEGAAFFLLPVIVIYFASGWRDATNTIALAIVAMAVLCAIFLRSSPPGQAATTRKPFSWQLLADPYLWCYTALFAGFMVGTRTGQAWIAIYLADVYAEAYGYDTNAAVVAAGIFATVAYSLLGRGVGVPAAGKLSDVLVQKGISRTVVVIGWLVLVIVLFQALSMRVTALWLLADHRRARGNVGQLLHVDYGVCVGDIRSTENRLNHRFHQHVRTTRRRDVACRERLSRCLHGRRQHRPAG